jgi:hypothetical protein
MNPAQQPGPLLSLEELAAKSPAWRARKGLWKLIVHTHPSLDLWEIFYGSRAEIEYFQRDQGGPVYNCDGIVSCLKISSRRAMVLGAYHVGEPRVLDLAAIDPPESMAAEYRAWRDNQTKPALRYPLSYTDMLKHLELRVVIEVPTRSMKLNSIDRGVVELREPGCVGPCPDYDAIDVTLSKLRYVLDNPAANPEWKDKLSAVGGIYLMTDYANNRLYVGKTDARRGFWDRWGAYAYQKTGNKYVDPAFESLALRPEKTKMSILEVVPRKSATELVIEGLEARWMRRLCTRETGYN